MNTASDHGARSRPTPPAEAEIYSKTPVFIAETVPSKLTQAHSTKPGVWG